MILRTDVADSGLYIMKHWVASMISALESDSNILNESIENELIPFLAKNQYKSKLRKYVHKSKWEKRFDFEDP